MLESNRQLCVSLILSLLCGSLLAVLYTLTLVTSNQKFCYYHSYLYVL